MTTPSTAARSGASRRSSRPSFGRACITLTFDRKGRLIGSCISLTEGPALYMFDPDTLDILAFRQLPFVPPPAGTNPALNTTGGAYFYLDRKDRVVSATTDRKILVVKEAKKDGQPVFRRVAEYDPRPCLQPGERMPSVLPDYKGRLWFVGRQRGTIGVLDPEDRSAAARSCSSEEIENSFAIARDGAYIVTDKAMYKLRARSNLKPRVVWSARYRERRPHEGRPDQRGLGHHADADGPGRRVHATPRPTWRSPTTPTRSTSSSTAPPTGSRRAASGWSAAFPSSPRARARTRTR